MSDTEAPEDFADRTADEVSLLNRQFKGAGYSGAYCAPPAPGHNTHGFWHYFPVHTRTGYAAHAIALHSMLIDAAKIPTSLIPHRMNAIDIDQFPKDRADMLVKWMADAVGLPEAIIISLPPDLTMWDMSRALVNYVAFEATRVSDSVAAVANDKNLTALWCVSDFTSQAYRAAGVNPDKVFTVRPPICDGPWRDMFAPVIEKPNVDKPFIFGSLGTWHERKGFHDLVRAYFRSFKRSDGVELHIRTSSFDNKLTIKKFEEKIVAEIAEIAKVEFGDANYPDSKKQPKIKLITGSALTDQEVIAWFKTLDCYVNASYGEGLGIPHMWAMAQGVPLISSDFGAVGQFLCEAKSTDLMFESKTVQVPAAMRAHADTFGEQSEWGGYEVDALAAMMVRASKVRVRHPVLARYVRKYFSYAECLPSLQAALPLICRPEMVQKLASLP